MERMLTPSASKRSYQLLLLSLLLLVFKLGLSKDHNSSCKHMVLYYHDILFNGTNQANATSAVISNINPSLGNFNFSNFVVFDDPVTADGRLFSPPVTQAQGFYSYDTKNEFNAWFAVTQVFNSIEYKGTISVMGADIISEETRDLSVVGGTGDFFMTRRIATFRTEAVQGWAYFRLRINIKLDECIA